MKDSIVFKIAEYDFEFEEINKLNYETFVEEIPQHKQNESKILKDKFDKENIYFIALKNNELLGMLAVRDKRPFSLDQKLENLDSYLPPAKSMCEIRLLSVKKEYRKGSLLKGLLTIVMQYIEDKEYDMVLISGILNQQKLYKHIGFVPFGPIVGNDKSKFQPMYITKESYNLKNLLRPKQEFSFLPGPVEISTKVKKTFSEIPISHRSEKFKNMFLNLKNTLCDFVNAKYVEIFMGSGTLANDIICAQISLLEGTGLILSNGEFGDRLINHANGFELNFEEYKIKWGESFDLRKIENILDQNESIKWVYMVHCETSTGVLNNIKSISQICKSKQVLFCLDAISSIGNVEVDLSEVYLASCVSGKGLESYCGLSMVFYNHELLESKNKIPRYLDLYTYKNKEGIPYTISSNLTEALYTSLKNLDKGKKFKSIEDMNNYSRIELDKLGMTPLVDKNLGNPAVITIPISSEYSSKNIGDFLKNNGYLISYESTYLLERNWIQFSFMGNISIEKLKSLIEILKKIKA
ncbi:aminotransferase class V-fold PLP-dependent enzyme [Tepidibacter hydrothermalis]|uniref:Aminotransferase class V-fold PLP-dependent enzyme n=1 Tax=Tepidibacter hydrothermalis TaxID=3036126 RepID=A0ABY8EA74_9FIRM|nr:aminotransferase class V-fold PLP-dependent enzyme [Tepidibacter hydrothermalis]WFD09833.1 aminotransferase class V-fold PLP-dependent enzyme [Tepidibacter hydrothermalis]